MRGVSQQLGAAPDIVPTTFAILFGAVAFGLALAFGLGNRDLAGQVTREWYGRYRAERDAIERERAEREQEEEAEMIASDETVELKVPPRIADREVTERGKEVVQERP